MSRSIMHVWETCLLGAIQGLTEFLPISSSGHLTIARHLLPSNGADPVTVEVALHVGTLVAVLAYFATDLTAMARGLVRPAAGPAHARLWVGLLALGSLPGAVVYLVAGEWIEGAFESLAVVGVDLLITAAVLASVARSGEGTKGEAGIRPIDALIVGTSQGIALLPGISRSGMTIAAGMLLGMRGEVAARFSFLLAIPAVMGAEMVKLSALLNSSADAAVAIGAGTAVAAVTGWFAIDILLRLVRRGKLGYFAVYCAVVGTLVLSAGLAGW